MLRRLLGAVSALAFALGSLWLLAGTLRLIFGVRITLALIPPLALERIDVPAAFGMAAGFTLLGALLGRVSRADGTVARDRERAAVR